jgi:2-polyprenyl-6-methoxyphenol hydroxylase-like FAD-dependent oxidoreductase
MVMEDAYVLADGLRRAETVEHRLDSYEARRKPRATWVQQQSRSLVESYLMPSSECNGAFRGWGSQALHDVFEPLVAEPSRLWVKVDILGWCQTAL